MFSKDTQGAFRREVHTDRLKNMQSTRSDIGYLISAKYIDVQLGFNGLIIRHLSFYRYEFM
jgi:hypothetical protein